MKQRLSENELILTDEKDPRERLRRAVGIIGRLVFLAPWEDELKNPESRNYETWKEAIAEGVDFIREENGHGKEVGS